MKITDGFGRINLAEGVKRGEEDKSVKRVMNFQSFDQELEARWQHEKLISFVFRSERVYHPTTLIPPSINLIDRPYQSRTNQILLIKFLNKIKKIQS